MRETLYELLHQLGFALALPLAVATVWIVRGDRAGAEATWTATAYRAELAALPLPTPQRLRAPRDESYRPGVHRHPEDPIARRRRATPPELGARQPSEIPREVASGQARDVAPSLRDSQPVPQAAPALAARDALPFLATPILVTSRVADSSTPIAASAGGGVAAVPSAEPEPVAEVTARAKTAPEKAAPAQTANQSVRTLSGKASDSISASASSSRPTSRNSRAGSSNRGSGAALRRESAAEVREASERGAGGSGSEKGWPEELSAAPSSLALAYTASAAGDASDLSLDRKQGTDSLLDASLPAPLLTSQPTEWLVAADTLVASPDPIGAMAPATLSDYAWVTPEALAGSTGGADVPSSPAAVSGSSLFSPTFTVHTIPEPASALLLGATLAGLAAARRRRLRE